MPDTNYKDLIAETNKVLPRVGTVLAAANAAREWNLRGYANGARLRGLEQLYEYLEKSHHLLTGSNWARDFAFLIARARTDFDVALESTLSGYVSGAFEAMRDVLEIELLLRDFTAFPDNAHEWLTASERDRSKRFRPAELRKRQKQIGHRWSESDESDYRGHSVGLHVTPSNTPFSTKTSGAQLLFGVDMAFWDIFDHARRIVLVLDMMFSERGIGPKPIDDPNRDLLAIKEGWARTLHIQRIFMTLLENPPTETDAEALKAINYLPFVFDSLDDEENHPQQDKG